MCPEKLDQGTVKKCVDDRADPHDHPYIIPGDQAEDNSGQHTDNISHDTGKLERDPALCPFLENEGHTVIRCNAHLSHHVKGYAKPCKDASENQDENPKRQCHVSRDHILNQPTDEIRPVSYTHHVYDRAGANAPADCKKNDDQDNQIYDKLPCAETHADEAADAEVHTGKRIYPESAKPVAAHTDADEENACQHHYASFCKVSS